MMAIQLSLSMSASSQTGDGERRPDARACTRGGLRPALEPMTSCPRCGWTLCALVVLGRAVRHHAVLLNSPGAGREVVRGALNGAGGGLVGHSDREATIFTAAICWYLQVAGHALRTALGVGARGQHGAVVARAGVCPRCRRRTRRSRTDSTSYSNWHCAAGTAGSSLLRWRGRVARAVGAFAVGAVGERGVIRGAPMVGRSLQAQMASSRSAAPQCRLAGAARWWASVPVHSGG